MAPGIMLSVAAFMMSEGHSSCTVKPIRNFVTGTISANGGQSLLTALGETAAGLVAGRLWAYDYHNDEAFVLIIYSQNFEVANVFTLSETGYGNEDSASDFFTTIGTEGGDYPVPLQASPDHDMLWISGNVSMTENGTVKFEPTMAGVLDWGIQAYAAAGKLLPASSKASLKSGTTVDRFLSYLWLTNDDYGQSDFPKQQQGWDGTLLTARELSKGTISNVVDNSLVHEQASWLVTARNESAGTVELTTLRQKIVREAYSAFTENATELYHQQACNIKSNRDFDFAPSSKFFVLRATIEFPNSARGNDSDVKAGFRILESDVESTSIYYRKPLQCTYGIWHGR